MHDLSTIAELNARAIERSIPQQLAAGKHAVLHYTGLHFFGASFHDTAQEAAEARAKASAGAAPGDRFVIQSPAQEPVAA